MYKVGDIITQTKEMDFHGSEDGDKILPIGTKWQITGMENEWDRYWVKIIEDLYFAPKSSALADREFIVEFFE